jgi:hypothetical protein
MIYGGEVVLWRESPARQLEPTAAYSLGVFMRWVEKPQECHWVDNPNAPLTLLTYLLRVGHFF